MSMQINLLMGGSNSRTERQYPQQEAKAQLDPQSPYPNNLPPRPPVSPSNQNTLSRSIPKREDNADYMSRFVEELPEERLHKSKSKSMKLNQSNRGGNSQVETRLKVKENVVTVKELPPVLNSNLKGTTVPGFETEEFQQKRFKKFSINALIKEKDMIKESNYFDESRFGEAGINPIVDRARADFRIGEYGQFQTFQVKTYLYDRNLNQQFTN